MKENTQLKKFGIFMEVPTAKIRVVEAIERNNDEGEFNLSAIKPVLSTGFYCFMEPLSVDNFSPCTV